jgi:hypothetical protein
MLAPIWAGVEFDLLVDGYGDVIVYPSVIPKRPA